MEAIESTIRAGNTFSEGALQVIIQATKQVPVAKNEICDVKADSKSVVEAGDTFGSVKASRKDEVWD